MNTDIILITDSKERIPQKKHETESLDIFFIKRELEDLNYDVTITNYYNILNNYDDRDIKNKVFFYASSQYLNYSDYILDCLSYIKQCSGKIVPDINLFLAHENKVFQELEKKRMKISSPKSLIIGTLEEGIALSRDLKYPFVAKTSFGFSSKGVSKINNRKETIKFLKRNMIRYDGNSINYKLIHFLRKLKFRNAYPVKTGKIIFQEMIEDLNSDWKVLIFYDRVFTLKRYTKKGDFKASGSGLFDFDAEPSKLLLDFAISVRELLETPFASLDIAIKDEKPYLIEYQALHFGLITAMDNKFYYTLRDQEWSKKSNDFLVEDNFVYGLHKYLNK